MNQVAIMRRKRFLKGLTEQGMVNAAGVVSQQSPHLTPGSAKVTAHRMLTDINSDPDLAQELAKVMSAEEVKEGLTNLARNAPNDGHKIRAYELLARVHALLIDKQEVSTRELPQIPAEIGSLETDQLVGLVIDRLKLSNQGIETPASVGEGSVSDLPVTQDDTVNK